MTLDWVFTKRILTNLKRITKNVELPFKVRFSCHPPLIGFVLFFFLFFLFLNFNFFSSNITGAVYINALRRKKLICWYNFFVIFYVNKQILSMHAVASISSWCARFKNDGLLDSAFTFLWNFSAKVISSPTYDSEVCFIVYGISLYVCMVWFFMSFFHQLICLKCPRVDWSGNSSSSIWSISYCSEITSCFFFSIGFWFDNGSWQIVAT